jgi:hypothetical protein
MNELQLSRRNLKSDDETRGGGGQKVLSCKKLDESSQSENIHKIHPLANPRLANALKWCQMRKLERDNVRLTVKGRN